MCGVTTLPILPLDWWLELEADLTVRFILADNDEDDDDNVLEAVAVVETVERRTSEEVDTIGGEGSSWGVAWSSVSWKSSLMSDFENRAF